jgi:hypothetical protein
MTLRWFLALSTSSITTVSDIIATFYLPTVQRPRMPFFVHIKNVALYKVKNDKYELCITVTLRK